MAAPPQQIDRAAEILARGGVIAFPTETVYGLAARVGDDAAVQRLFELKGRPRTRPMSICVADREGLETYAARVPSAARRLADALWPGPLTLVLPRRADVPDVVTGGGETVGIRVPDHPVALALLRALERRCGPGSGVAAPSANRFGEPPPTTASGVIEALGQPAAGRSEAPDLVLDGGRCPGGVPSTVLLCASERPRVLRPGAISREALERLLGAPVDPP